MLRALSTHVKDDAVAAGGGGGGGGGGGLTVTYYVYTSRLLFELIADPAISGMMKSLEPVAHVSLFLSPLQLCFVFVSFFALSLSCSWSSPVLHDRFTTLFHHRCFREQESF